MSPDFTLFIKLSYLDFWPDLQLRWQQCCQRFDIPPQAAANQLEDIQQKYTGKKRQYHNLSHLQSMFQLLDQQECTESDKSLLTWAIFFHDLIYNVQRKDNESRSAQAATQFLQAFLRKQDLQLLVQIIEDTKFHRPTDQHHLSQLMLDLDLAILSADHYLYDMYRVAIRKEYSIYPTALYNPGRKKVLRSFLERETIYYTSSFQKEREENARTNLEWELQQL